jgi:hypothetical protein
MKLVVLLLGLLMAAFGVVEGTPYAAGEIAETIAIEER